MDFDKDSLLQFFNHKLAEAEKIDAANDEDSLERWWSNVKRCCEKMGPEYVQLLGDVRFHSSVYLMGNPDFNSGADESARISGLGQAKNNIQKVIDDLETFGYKPTAVSKALRKPTSKTVNNFNINQSQRMSVSINISDFDSETQKNIRDLQSELAKKKKNREVIKKILAKLGETGLDALEKIFLHTIRIN